MTLLREKEIWKRPRELETRRANRIGIERKLIELNHYKLPIKQLQANTSKRNSLALLSSNQIAKATHRSVSPVPEVRP